MVLSSLGKRTQAGRAQLLSTMIFPFLYESLYIYALWCCRMSDSTKKLGSPSHVEVNSRLLHRDEPSKEISTKPYYQINVFEIMQF